jgi:hypothetical protein
MVWWLVLTIGGVIPVPYDTMEDCTKALELTKMKDAACIPQPVSDLYKWAYINNGKYPVDQNTYTFED